MSTAASLAADITRLAKRWRELAELAFADAAAGKCTVGEAAAIAATLKTCADMADAAVAGASERDVVLTRLRRELAESGLTATGRRLRDPGPQELPGRQETGD